MAAAANNDSDWLEYVKESLEKDEVGADETKPDACIFGIAHPLVRLKPETYIPQVISIGPYHYRKLQQYEETDTLKLKMARAWERKFHEFKFRKLVEKIESFEDAIRACYHKHIPYDIETLSWMLALDTSFILQFLKSIYSPYEDNVESQSRFMRKHSFLHSKRKTPLWYAIKNDILMLENQVPMFLLIEALCSTANRNQSDTQVGSRSQRQICQQNGSIPLARSVSQREISQDTVRGQEKREISQDTVRGQEIFHLAFILEAACSHLNPFGQRNHHTRDVETNVPDHKKYRPVALNVEIKSHVLDYLYGYVTAASRGDPKQTKSELQIQVSRSELSNHEKNPLYHLGGINLIIRLGEMFKRMRSATTAGNLPSATELSEKGIKFAPYDSGDLGKIIFNGTTSTFLLPKITINDSTEVVLRNLVALELNLQTNQKPVTRYTYLMDRLIDTERDVALLKRRGIFISEMGSDAEVAQMWNSMSKSTWENTFDPIDEAIEEAKKYYRSKWRVLLAQFQKTHCSKPWLVISVISAVILLSLTAVQVFCLFYTCHK